MPTETQLDTSVIRNIRKFKGFQKKDCANVLGISKETYHNMEDGLIPFSLPELELLSHFFGMPVLALIDQRESHASQQYLMHDDVHPQYLSLRTKMIAAMITYSRELAGLSIEDFHKATLINPDTLQAYEQGTASIPVTDLNKISAFLGLPIETFFDPMWAKNSDGSPLWALMRINNESDQETSKKDQAFEDLFQGLKQLSPSDQAEVARIILKKLKS